MTWGAHKADVRIAAKNSVTMRAALRASINAQTIYEAYQETHPFVTDNNTQDRTRARAWAMLHVKIDAEPIKAALTKIYTDGFLLGLDASKEAIAQAEKKQGKALTKSEDSDYVDWANWKPGNRAAALLYRPTGAFEKILANAGIVSKKIAANGYDRIGTALADSVAAGFSPARAAKVITEKIGDPARALTIAITEQNRAMSLASMQNYQQYGVEKVEWSGANPCDICAPNEGQVVFTGEPFNSGDTEPPVHPNCRCAVLPVIAEDFLEGVNDMDLLPPLEGATGEAEDYPTLNEEQREEMSKYQLEDKDFMALMKQDYTVNGRTYQGESAVYDSLRSYKGIGYEEINKYLRTGEEPKWMRLSTIKSNIENIDKAMAQAPGLPQGITTYRSVKNQDLSRFLESRNPGQVYGDEGYSSTTMSKSYADNWEQGEHAWLITIENPAGTKGIMMEGAIGKGDESEWLLPKDTQFKVIEIDTTTNNIKVRVKG